MIKNKILSKKIRILILLIVLSILIMPLGGILVMLYSIKMNYPIAMYFKNNFIYYFFLPIPIISVIVGICYQKKYTNIIELEKILNSKEEWIKAYFKKKINDMSKATIIVGIIMTILIGIWGHFFDFLPEATYDDIVVYQPIMKVNLPREGKFYKVKWTESFYLNHISSYSLFPTESVSMEFYDSLKANENWITEEQRKENQLDSISLNTMCESSKKECYYLYYFEDAKEYNKLPDKLSNSHVYIMIYDPDVYCLKIEDFIYPGQEETKK